MSKAVVICSGGMDSVTLAHDVKRNYADEVYGLGFDYGQRHKKELEFAKQLVEDGILDDYTVVDLSSIQELVSASTLTDLTREVPDGLYSEEQMKLTVVPNRNMIMLSIAVGYAVTIQAREGVFTGVHGGDHFIYPDCRPDFIYYADGAAIKGNEGFIEWAASRAIITPYIRLGKHDIAARGAELQVDFLKTWSCYKGGDVHCGRCGTCTERKEAFRLAKVVDPTEYLDPDFKIEAYRG